MNAHLLSGMAGKSEQLQIRVTRLQKARLRQLARRAGLDVSAYVLAHALPARREAFQRTVASLRREENRRYAFAALSDLLAPLGAGELEDTVSLIDISGLSAFAENYLAATVEYLCAKRGAAVPEWVRSVEPLEAPWFATDLRTLRAHLLRASPVAFRRRNLFIDSGPDARLQRDA